MCIHIYIYTCMVSVFGVVNVVWGICFVFGSLDPQEIGECNQLSCSMPYLLISSVSGLPLLPLKPNMYMLLSRVH